MYYLKRDLKTLKKNAYNNGAKSRDLYTITLLLIFNIAEIVGSDLDKTKANPSVRCLNL